jgi:hypothetical protein
MREASISTGSSLSIGSKKIVHACCVRVPSTCCRCQPISTNLLPDGAVTKCGSAIGAIRDGNLRYFTWDGYVAYDKPAVQWDNVCAAMWSFPKGDLITGRECRQALAVPLPGLRCTEGLLLVETPPPVTTPTPQPCPASPKMTTRTTHSCIVYQFLLPSSKQNYEVPERVLWRHLKSELPGLGTFPAQIALLVWLCQDMQAQKPEGYLLLLDWGNILFGKVPQGRHLGRFARLG